MTNRIQRALLFAACAAAAVGCTSGDPETQVLTGRIQTSGALAVRAITNDSVITAATVRSDGSFTLELPAGQRYRLEVLTTSGVRHIVTANNGTLTALSFEVCDPTAPFDVGGIAPNEGLGGGGGGGGECDPLDPDCKPTPCDPSDPNCAPGPCMDPTDGTDPGCVPAPPCGPNDPMCEPPPKCDPNDPTCEPPPPCQPGEPNCDVCASGSMDPACWPCQPGDPSCEPPPPPECMDPSDPYCWCDANGDCPPPTCGPDDAMCPPPPPPPCSDPMDPNTCKDPCVEDPAQCGCSSMEPNCWPPPQPPECENGMCDPGDGWMTPEHPPIDFGCAQPGTMEPGPNMEPGTK